MVSISWHLFKIHSTHKSYFSYAKQNTSDAYQQPKAVVGGDSAMKLFVFLNMTVSRTTILEEEGLIQGFGVDVASLK